MNKNKKILKPSLILLCLNISINMYAGIDGCIPTLSNSKLFEENVLRPNNTTVTNENEEGVDNGQDINLQLEEAALNGNLDHVLNLVTNGARVYFIDEYDNVGIDMIFTDNLYQVVFNHAVIGGYLNLLKSLLNTYKQEIDVNKGDNDGRTALHFAALTGNLEVLLFLLEIHANVHQVDNCGRTVLHFAALNRHSNLVLALLEAQVNINARDNDGRTILHSAVNKNDLNFILVLLLTEIDINIVNNDHQTAFDDVKNSRNTIVKILLFVMKLIVEDNFQSDDLMSFYNGENTSEFQNFIKVMIRWFNKKIKDDNQYVRVITIRNALVNFLTQVQKSISGQNNNDEHLLSAINLFNSLFSSNRKNAYSA